MILYVYSTKSKNSTLKRIKKIEEELTKIYGDITSVSYDDLSKINKDEISTLIFSGGDGFFNRIVNDFVLYLDKITFGFIPLGTANDISHNHGIKNAKESLDVIKCGKVEEETILKINDKYLIYALSVGEMSKVSIGTSRNKKRRYGKLIYKIRGIRYLFAKKKEIIINGKKEKLKVLIALKSKYLGGVKIANNYDDYLHLYKIRNIFDIISLFIFGRFHKKELERFASVEIESNSIWCIDGEELDTTKGILEYSNKKIKLLSKSTWQQYLKVI